jgi:MoxR-like ATPase
MMIDTSDLKEVIDVVTDPLAGKALMIVGKTAIGKTRIVEQYCKENDYHLEKLNASLISDGDIVTPKVRLYMNAEDMQDDNEASFNINRAFSRIISLEKKRQQLLKEGKTEEAEKMSKGYVLFIDEINRPSIPELFNQLMNIILDREIVGHRLPDNCRIVAACNPSYDMQSMFDDDIQNENMDVEIMDSALRTRFTWVFVQSSWESFYQWASQPDDRYADEKYPQEVKETIIYKPLLDYFNNHQGQDEYKDVNAYINPSHRGIEAVSEIYKSLIISGKLEKTSETTLRALIAGNLGTYLAEGVYNYIRKYGSNKNLINPKDFYENPEKTSEIIDSLKDFI